ncbi:MAG: sensor histidine kinase [Cytophagales bacterium]|nr:MAG: sensor histidine kinase [Cytophagales bacterium]
MDVSPRLRWVIRYKLHHLPFWLVYHYVWWVVAIGNPGKVISTLLDLPYALKFSFYVFFQAGAVYINLYVLIPFYLTKQRYASYLATLLLVMLTASSCIVVGYYLSSYLSGRTLDALYGAGATREGFFRFFGTAFPSTVAAVTLVMSIKITKNWLQSRQRQQMLEAEKLTAELAFLRNQFNPHFLFNTINSIFFLIHKNPDEASVSLATFSDLLRYQLYECNEPLIPLGKEIAYVEGYIRLERLRQNANLRVQVDIDHTQPDTLSIAPFMLLGFIENAFKHVSKHRDRPNWITIRLTVTGSELTVCVANSATLATEEEPPTHGGLGLPNVQRRLALLYGGRHELRIDRQPHLYTVMLRLTLTELIPIPSLQTA